MSRPTSLWAGWLQSLRQPASASFLALACSLVPVACLAQSPAANFADTVDSALQSPAADNAKSPAAGDVEAPPPVVEQQPIPISTAVHTESSDGKVRLVFDLSAPVPATAFVLADPRRVVVDLPDVDFEIDPQVGLPSRSPRPAAPAPRRHRRISAGIPHRGFPVRASFAPGRSRIVIDLAAPARIERAASEPISRQWAAFRDRAGAHRRSIICGCGAKQL